MTIMTDRPTTTKPRTHTVPRLLVAAASVTDAAGVTDEARVTVEHTNVRPVVAISVRHTVANKMQVADRIAAAVVPGGRTTVIRYDSGLVVAWFRHEADGVMFDVTATLDEGGDVE
jgi:hypothetical protein